MALPLQQRGGSCPSRGPGGSFLQKPGDEPRFNPPALLYSSVTMDSIGVYFFQIPNTLICSVALD